MSRLAMYEVTIGMQLEDGDYCDDYDKVTVIAEDGEKAIEKALTRPAYPSKIAFVSEIRFLGRADREAE